MASFDEAMDDDFNTADAIAAIFELVKFVNVNAKGRMQPGVFECAERRNYIIIGYLRAYGGKEAGNAGC